MTRHKTLQKTYPVLSMSCASCAARVNKILNQQAGVVQATVNYAAATALIEFNPEVTSPETLRDAVQKAGFD